MQRIEAILRKEIGLDAASLGSPHLERVTLSRMKVHGLKNSEDYDQLLADSPEELSALIEAVVVTETWFMRGREAFAAFAGLALNEWLPRNPAGVMRVLSLPCSSGEEPYSIAMTLLDAGLLGDRFAIDAVDISANALARADNAIYGKNSFRGNHLDFRDRYFIPVEEGYALSPDIQRHVTFQRDNLLCQGFFAGARYDFIFCRNLLIYFDRAIQAIAVKRLRAMLASEGVLFVGPAEMPIVKENGFMSANLPLSFASRIEVDRAVAGSRKSEVSGQRSNFRSAILESSRSGKMVSPLKIARQLADAGQLAAAAALCDKHICANDTCPEGYYLMGLVKAAANDPVAINFYRKAIYLDPNHYEALVQASLWLGKSGDVSSADTFKRRAERIQQKNGNQS